MRLTTATLLTVAMMMSGAPALALDWTRTLPPDAVAALPEETRALYAEAIRHIDRIDYDGGVKLLGQAAETAPESLELQFFTLARARDRAEVYYSAASYAPVPENMTYGTPPWRTSEGFYEIADTAMRRIQENPSLGAEQKNRMQQEANALTEGRTTLQERDKKRFETGIPVTDEVYEIRKGALGLEEPEPTADRLAAKAAEMASDAAQPAGTEGEKKEGDKFAEVDPFAPLPGEYTQSITDLLPVPVQPQQGAAFGGEFGDPALTGAQPSNYFGGAAPPADPNANPFGAPAPAGGDPFGGGGAAAPPPAADPFGGGGK